MPTDNNVNTLIINTLTQTQFEQIEQPSSTELYFVEETEINPDYAQNSEVVHNTGAENINGIKTFVDGAVINNGTATTVASTDNSNNIATTAFVQTVIVPLLTRIQQLEEQVAALTE